MKITKNLFLSAVKNRILLVGPMATTKPPDYGPSLYIDGGSRWREENSAVQLSIGDGDSSSGNLDLQFPTDKDQSDLRLALDILPHQSLKLWLWGFLGGEKAHELINIGMLAEFIDGRPPSLALFDKHLLIVSPGQWQIPMNGSFSLISVQPNQITLNGPCQFPLATETHLPAFSSLGLSNKASGTISVTCRRPLLIVGRPALALADQLLDIVLP